MNYLKIISIAAMVLLVGAVIALSAIVGAQADEIREDRAIIDSLLSENNALNDNLREAITRTAISFSITPSITNKVTSAFGSTKNVTLQYYFTLDGSAIITKPDSIYTVIKN
ncbi:MAG: hypothetical protein LBS50_01405 [Prevotellaceae bacterium]|jgi:hypothetical protein|nr:hypothetical protein [Prevotellaceae bacterium]